MKIRAGFVSNSSSSSFICDAGFSIAETKEKLNVILNCWKQLTNDPITFDEAFKKPFKCNKKYVKYLKGWDQYNERGVKGLGKIIIESAEDNSIPYALFELIEHAFNATRIHLG